MNTEKHITWATKKPLLPSNKLVVLIGISIMGYFINPTTKSSITPLQNPTANRDVFHCSPVSKRGWALNSLCEFLPPKQGGFSVHPGDPKAMREPVPKASETESS